MSEQECKRETIQAPNGISDAGVMGEDDQFCFNSDEGICPHLVEEMMNCQAFDVTLTMSGNHFQRHEKCIQGEVKKR